MLYAFCARIDSQHHCSENKETFKHSGHFKPNKGPALELVTLFERVARTVLHARGPD